MQYFYSVFCTLITVSSTQLNLKSLVNLVCMSLDDEEEEETIFFWVTLSIASQCLHPQVIPSSSIPPCCPLMLPSHWCFSFLTTCPFLSFSIPPFLPLSCHSVVKWNEVSAEFIIPPAAVCQQQLSFPHVSLPFFLPSPLPLFVTLTAHLFFLPSFTLSCLLPSLSLSLNPFHLCCHPLFYFPHRQACQEDSATCPHAVWCCSICMCMCPYSARCEHIVVCERHCLCPLDIKQVWAWVSLSLCFSRTQKEIKLRKGYSLGIFLHACKDEKTEECKQIWSPGQIA